MVELIKTVKIDHFFVCKCVSENIHTVYTHGRDTILGIMTTEGREDQ